MDTVLNTPVHVLDKLLALNLDITVWTAKTKLTAEDFGGVQLPPEDIASLGNKKICDPEKLKVFTRLRARAFTMLDRCGVRFLSGWAIPEDKADEVIKALCDIRNEFMTAKTEFLAVYDEAVRDWIEAHPSWASLISSSTVSREYVERKLTFVWQLYRVAPADTIDEQAAQDFGLNSEIENLGNTLFREISKDAADIWKNIFEGKTSVSQKALSPLRTMQTKLNGLSFVEPHVIPVHALIETALSKMPRKGAITGAPLLMLQGLVSLLKDSPALVTQAEAMMNAASQDAEIEELFDGFTQPAPNLILAIGAGEATETPNPVSHIDSMGLW